MEELPSLRTRHRLTDESGFTLIELMVVILLMSILATISMTAFRSYARAQAHAGAQREVVAILRNTHQRAATEVSTYQCRFNSTTLRIYRDAANPPTASPTRTYQLAPNLEFVNPTFTDSLGNTSANCLFFARGSATPGSVTIRRTDVSPPKNRNINVEGLTGRVSY